jgi:hypothetical protein
MAGAANAMKPAHGSLLGQRHGSLLFRNCKMMTVVIM